MYNKCLILNLGVPLKLQIYNILYKLNIKKYYNLNSEKYEVVVSPYK